MRCWFLLLMLFGAVSCSRRPSPQEAYQEAWSAFQQGNLGHAQDVVTAALGQHKSQPSDQASVRLELLHAEILLGRRQTRDALQILDRLSALEDPALRLRWLVDRADAAWKMGDGAKARALLDEADPVMDADVDRNSRR